MTYTHHMEEGILKLTMTQIEKPHSDTMTYIASSKKFLATLGRSPEGNDVFIFSVDEAKFLTPKGLFHVSFIPVKISVCEVGYLSDHLSRYFEQ